MVEESKARDAFVALWLELMDNVNTFFPAEIVRIRDNGLVDVQPAVKVRFFSENEDTLLPIIPNVVLINFRTEKVIVRPPKESLKGTKVGVFCAQHSLTEWRSKKAIPYMPIEGRRFNINDAVAVLGLYPETLPWLIEQKPNTFEIQVHEDQKIGIGNTAGDEIIDLIHQIVEILLQPDSGGYNYPTQVSSKGKKLSDIKPILAKLGNVI